MNRWKMEPSYIDAWNPAHWIERRMDEIFPNGWIDGLKATLDGQMDADNLPHWMDELWNLIKYQMGG